MSQVEKDAAEKKVLSEIDKVEKEIDDPELAQGTAVEYSRVSGYYRASKYINHDTNKDDTSFNKGKYQEWSERKMYKVSWINNFVI